MNKILKKTLAVMVAGMCMTSLAVTSFAQSAGSGNYGGLSIGNPLWGEIQEDSNGSEKRFCVPGPYGEYEEMMFSKLQSGEITADEYIAIINDNRNNPQNYDDGLSAGGELSVGGELTMGGGIPLDSAVSDSDSSVVLPKGEITGFDSSAEQDTEISDGIDGDTKVDLDELIADADTQTDREEKEEPSFFEKVGNWFADLGESIADFFESIGDWFADLF